MKQTKQNRALNTRISQWYIPFSDAIAEGFGDTVNTIAYYYLQRECLKILDYLHRECLELLEE